MLKQQADEVQCVTLTQLLDILLAHHVFPFPVDQTGSVAPCVAPSGGTCGSRDVASLKKSRDERNGGQNAQTRRQTPLSLAGVSVGSETNHGLDPLWPERRHGYHEQTYGRHR